MPQSLIRLPKKADIEIVEVRIEIRDHKVPNKGGLMWFIMYLIQNHYSNKQTLVELEKYGVSYEAAIEYCAEEWEHDVNIRAYIISEYHSKWHSLETDTEDAWEYMINFSKSVTGIKIANQFVEKIRSCDNWGELYDELRQNSRFQKDMKNRIINELEQQCRKV